jgi:hypothetical protein
VLLSAGDCTPNPYFDRRTYCLRPTDQIVGFAATTSTKDNLAYFYNFQFILQSRCELEQPFGDMGYLKTVKAFQRQREKNWPLLKDLDFETYLVDRNTVAYQAWLYQMDEN